MRSCYKNIQQRAIQVGSTQRLHWMNKGLLMRWSTKLWIVHSTWHTTKSEEEDIVLGKVQWELSCHFYTTHDWRYCLEVMWTEKMRCSALDNCEGCDM
jgi:hypothetical protein